MSIDILGCFTIAALTAKPMVFEAVSDDGKRIVEVYERRVAYECEDGYWYVRGDGNRRPISVEAAMKEIAGWRERDSRYYKHTIRVSSKAMHGIIGIIVLSVTIALAIYVFTMIGI